MVAIDGNNVWVSSYAIRRGPGPEQTGSEKYGPSNHLVDISAATNKIIARVPSAGYPVESMLPHNNTLLMVGVDYVHGNSVLIRTHWPYQELTSVRPLGGCLRCGRHPRIPLDPELGRPHATDPPRLGPFSEQSAQQRLRLPVVRCSTRITEPKNRTLKPLTVLSAADERKSPKSREAATRVHSIPHDGAGRREQG